MSALLLLAGLLGRAPAEWGHDLRPCATHPPGAAHFVMVGRDVPPPSFELPRLFYGESDVRLMYRAAISRMCFRPDQITVLTGAQATRRGLLDRLAELPRLDRLFVFISAHGVPKRPGEDGYLIGLREPLDSEDLRRAVKARKAGETMVFLDTCSSAKAVPKKGIKEKITLQLLTEPDFFWLTAAAAAADEDHQLRAGAVTAQVLGIINQRASLDSQQLCEGLKMRFKYSGACVAPSDQRPVVIVPPQPTGEVVVEGASQAWHEFVYFDRAGAPLEKLIQEADHATARLAVGTYILRRTRHTPLDCRRTRRFTLRANERLVFTETDWRADDRTCDYITYRGRPVRWRPRVGLALEASGAAGWLARSGIEARGRIGVHWFIDRVRYGIYGLIAQSLIDDDDIAAHQRVGVGEVGLALAIDPLHHSSSTVDLFAGIEGGGALTRASRWGQSSLAALRLGVVWRVSTFAQPELIGRLGMRGYREFASSDLDTAFWATLGVGLTLGSSGTIDDP